MTENNTHEGNYTGTAATNAKNQDLEFVNDTLDGAKTAKNLIGAPLKDKN